MTQSVAVDLGNCAAEPIHIPGSIQPHGAMLVCESDEATIAFVSANAAALLGLGDTQVLGRSLADVLGVDGLHELRNGLAKVGAPPAAGVLLGFQLPHATTRFDVVAHQHEGRLIVEFERCEASTAAGSDALDIVQTLIRRIGLQSNVDSIADAAARLVHATLGYDRVMVYRFLHNGAGRVIAEAKRADLHSFFGQHFPAADIPQQARRLYLQNRLRVIGDAHYAPVPLRAAALAHSAPVDMSHAHLRSVSPIHCEYLRNMGVAASLSISIVIDGALWGLIACHHDTPKTIPFALRTAAEIFGQYVSMQIAVAQRREELHAAAAAGKKLDALARNFAHEQTLDEALRNRLPQLAELIECDGAALWLNGDWTALGSIPSRAEIGPVLRMLEDQDEAAIWETNELRIHHGLVNAATRVAGVLAIPLSIQPRDYLMLFRNEEAHSVVWADAPVKTLAPGPHGDRLAPRGSFDAWREDVRGRARPWTDGERSVAATIRTYLRDIALRHSELLDLERTRSEHRRRMMHDELQHRVKNILALVKSIASQTRVHAASVDDYAASLDSRLRALSYAHDQSLALGTRADLLALLQAEASLHQEGVGPRRVSMTGPAVGFTEQALVSVALLLHEMMTNAAKYGALSAPAGQLSIHWSLMEDGSCAIDWNESGGPPVAEPARKGFGSTLIDSMMTYDLDGAYEVRYRREGLQARFVIPARHVAHAQSAAPASPDLHTAARPLEDVDIMLIEDRALIAIDTENVLRKLGASRVVVFPAVAPAVAALATHNPDVAILDFNLGKGTSEMLADLLTDRGIPFVFLSGYANTATISERFAKARVIRKPVDATSVAEVLSDVLATRVTK